MKALKRIFWFLALPLILLLTILSLNGLTPSYLYHAPSVASSIGAKLLCSARYVSGFTPAQAESDLVQYSPILEYLSISYDDSNRVVTTSLLGLSEATASYDNGLGCYIDYEGYTARSEYRPTDKAPSNDRWPAGDRIDTIDPAWQELTNEIVRTDNEKGLNTRALLVVHNGNIVAESYAQQTDTDTPLLGWSMSKSLSSVMIGNLVYQGVLQEDIQPVFAEWANDERATITLPDLLTMTDGLSFVEDYSPGDDVTAMLFTDPAASDYAVARPLSREPGSYFHYSSGTATLLSRLYYLNTGESLTSFLAAYQQNIAQPLAFQHAVFEPDAAGVPVGSSYFFAPARDWARLGQLMLNKGTINGTRVVSETWVEKSLQPNNADNTRSYGYQWWLNTGDADKRWPSLPDSAFAATGNRQQFLMMVPSENLIVVRLGWTSGDYPTDQTVSRLLPSTVKGAGELK
jgi:CubicO group peptidase (beta-lactamase class C family)